MRAVWVVLLAHLVLLCAAAPPHDLRDHVVVVSIVDSSSVLSCFVKVFSILKSTRNAAQFHFKFLVLEENEAELTMPAAEPQQQPPPGGATQPDVQRRVRINTAQWTKLFTACFPGASFQAVSWQPPPSMPRLRGSSFEQEYIFSRIYLPLIFNDTQRYVYLDNDMVVTADVQELYATPLVVGPFKNTNNQFPPATRNIPGAPVPTGGAAAVGAGVRTPRSGRHSTGSTPQRAPKRIVSESERRREAALREQTFRKPPPPASFRPAVGFVYERHDYYNSYLASHFNLSHPLVRATQDAMVTSLFLNGGVALVDAALWRSRGMTAQAEELMRMNQPPELHDQMQGQGQGRRRTEAALESASVPLYSASAGDQGLFFLLLQNRVTYLPARWNMRRHPMKTTNMLTNTDATGEQCAVCCSTLWVSCRHALLLGCPAAGIVHLAGTTHGDGLSFCRDPLRYNIFISDVAPLYLSVMASFANEVLQPLHRAGELVDLLQTYLYVPPALCNNALERLHVYHKAHYRPPGARFFSSGAAMGGPTTGPAGGELRVAPGRYNPGLYAPFAWPPARLFP